MLYMYISFLAVHIHVGMYIFDLSCIYSIYNTHAYYVCI